MRSSISRAIAGNVGAPRTIASVMPVSAWMTGGIGTSGSTSELHSWTRGGPPEASSSTRTMTATADVAKWLKFHTSAPVTPDTLASSFALIGDVQALPSLDRFALGSNEYPDRSTTLIVQVDSLTSGPAYQLTGPGIDGTAILQATIRQDLFERLALNAILFPRGIDVVLVDDDRIVAIPRTTRLAAHGA